MLTVKNSNNRCSTVRTIDRFIWTDLFMGLFNFQCAMGAKNHSKRTFLDMISINLEGHFDETMFTGYNTLDTFILKMLIDISYWNQLITLFTSKISLRAEFCLMFN